MTSTKYPAVCDRFQNLATNFWCLPLHSKIAMENLPISRMIRLSQSPLLGCILLFSLALFQPCRLFAQSGAPNRPDRITLRFKTIGPEQGLPHKTVQVLFQDQLGLTWMGTPLGLVKYDGTRFTSYAYEPRDSAQAAQGTEAVNVLCITEDPGGDLWIGCSYEGPEKPVLFRFDRATEQLIPYLYDRQADTTIIRSGVRNFHVGQGYLWINANWLYRLPLEELDAPDPSFLVYQPDIPSFHR